MKNELPSFSLNFFALSILDSHLNYRTTEQILFAHLNGNELFIPRNSENCSDRTVPSILRRTFGTKFQW
jgi:hypothetical protein